MSAAVTDTGSGLSARGAAPRRARLAAQAAFEVRTVLGNAEQLLVSIVLPLLILLGLAIVPLPLPWTGPLAGLSRVEVATPGVLALAVVSTAFTGQAILLAYERRYGVLRLLGTTPLGRVDLLLAKTVAVLVVVAVQALVLSAVATGLGWSPRGLGTVPLTLAFLVAGSAVFVAAAGLLGGTLRAEAVLAVANLLWVLTLALGGVVLPAHTVPVLGGVAPWLPPGLLADGLRSVLTGVDDGIPAVLRLAALALWTLLLAAPAARWLRWSD